MKRIEPRLTEKFRKDPDTENFLARFNDILAPYQEEDYISDLPEEFPTVHVVGVPRSGTTLLVQLLAAHTDLGYINNLIAAFWRAPVYGIRLSKQVLPKETNISFRSEFGRTKGVQEPHEFGYFWSENLGYREMLEQTEEHDKKVDWERLRLILLNMVHAFGRPVLFKSFLLGWHIRTMQKVLPKTCWVHIRRDPIQNAISLIRLRENFLGSREKWASLKPQEFSWLKNRSCWEQVAGQVYFIERSLFSQLQTVSPENVVHLNYAELCSIPLKVLEKVEQMLAVQGVKVENREPPGTFNLNETALADVPGSDEIVSAWEHLCSEFGPLPVDF